MELIKFTEDIILSLVENRDIVAVKEFKTDDDSILFEVLIDEKDMPKIIGRGGKLINSIRTIVQTNSYLKDNRKVRINVDCVS